MPSLAELFPGVRTDEPLSRHSQFGVGGPADWFFSAPTVESLAEVVAAATSMGIPVTPIGAGSNTLILDRGVRGLVVQLAHKEVNMTAEGLLVSAGTMMPRLALDAARQGFSGLSFGIGVPGSTGGSIRGNAGAFGSEIAGVLVQCEVLDTRGNSRTISAEECEFGYRDSRFKRDWIDLMIVSGTFTVGRSDPHVLQQEVKAIQQQRKASQPYGIRSLGSVFKNPEGDYAGRLLEAAGMKGMVLGGAQVSPVHANFIVNVRHARAADVLALLELGRERVSRQFGVTLEPEIVVMGEKD